MEKIVYQIDKSGYYMYPQKAFPDPYNPEKYLIPKGCVEEQPPEVSVGNIAFWDNENKKWTEVPVPTDTTPDPADPEYTTWKEWAETYLEGVQQA